MTYEKMELKYEGGVQTRLICLRRLYSLQPFDMKLKQWNAQIYKWEDIKAVGMFHWNGGHTGSAFKKKKKKKASM